MQSKEIADIYKKTVNKVFRYVYSRVGNRELAEDIVTETYITYMDIADRYDGSSKIDTFIIGIARNKMLKALEKIKPGRYVDLDLDSIVVEEEQETEEVENKNDLLTKHMKKIINKLPKNHKEILQLRFTDMLTTEEIAEKMEITKGNVRVLQHRAISKAASLANKLNL